MPTKTLSRLDLSQRFDKLSNSMVVEHSGRGLEFDGDGIYGFPEGTVAVIKLDEIPLPDPIVTLADAAKIELSTHPRVPELVRAIGEALVAEMMVDAPKLLSEMAKPRVEWRQGDLHELQRKHVIAMARVEALERMLLADLRLRTGWKPVIGPGEIPAVVGPSAGEEIRRTAPIPAVPALRPAPKEEPEEDEEKEAPEERLVVSPATIKAIEAAVAAAREAELPQRMPHGARRKLRSMSAGIYVSVGSDLLQAADMCLALTEGQEKARSRGESVIIDSDGEWPVVARRFGHKGRIVYRVEEALKRAKIEEAA